MAAFTLAVHGDVVGAADGLVDGVVGQDDLGDTVKKNEMVQPVAREQVQHTGFHGERLDDRAVARKLVTPYGSREIAAVFASLLVVEQSGRRVVDGVSDKTGIPTAERAGIADVGQVASAVRWVNPDRRPHGLERPS